MKNIFRFFGALLTLVFTVSLTGCVEEQLESADVGLHVKVFFPSKVVAGQPMTINGSGFSDVTEIVFPGDVTVTDFEIVSNDMIRVKAPSGLPAEGGHIVVRTAEGEAESPLPLTLGSTLVSGCTMPEDGESISGGSQMTIYGTDLEFVNKIEMMDSDGNPVFIDEISFIRKGTSSIIFVVPKKVYDGEFESKVYTYDGKVFNLPKLPYEPIAGHWEVVETVIWENDGSVGAADWSGSPYRFAMEGKDSNNECVATIPTDLWEKMKSTPFYVQFTPVAGATWWQIRTLDGHWSIGNNDANDITPNTPDRFIDNGDGTYTFITDLQAYPAEGDKLVTTVDDKHLLYGGSGFIIQKMYFTEEVWVEDSGSETVKVDQVLFEGEVAYADWSATQVIDASFFKDVVEGATITVTIKDKGDDYNPLFKHASDWSDWSELQSAKVDTGDGFYTVVPAEAVEELKTQGLRFQGIGFTVVKVTLTTWVTLGPVTEEVLYEGETVYDSWGVSQLLGPALFSNVAEGFTIKVFIKDKGDDYNPIFKHDNYEDWTELQSGKVDEDDCFYTVVPASAIEELKTVGLRFQGVGFTITKIMLIPA